MHTHYDNLKVSREAPDEVIRAAYRALAQKHHPDRNPDPRSADRMRLINEAYSVLSDPAQRAAHDEWISQASGLSPLEPVWREDDARDPEIVITPFEPPSRAMQIQEAARLESDAYQRKLNRVYYAILVIAAAFLCWEFYFSRL